MTEIVRRAGSLLLLAPVYLYRWCISPMFPPACRFAPTCSEYAIDAITLHGPIRGSWLTARRILRCHPVKILGGASGFDPVPPRKSESHG